MTSTDETTYDRPAPAADLIPLSVGQEAMWVGWKVDPDQWTQIISLPFQVVGALDLDRLCRAVDALTHAHPQLLGRVVETPDGPHLDRSGGPEVPVVEHDVDGPLPEEVRRIWRRPFDLRRGPLLRVDVVRGAAGTVLHVAMHHLVTDGASILLVCEDLRRAYAGLPLPRPDGVAALTAVAARSRALGDGPDGAVHREHWRAVFADRPPVLRVPESVDPPGAAAVDTVLGGDLVARLRSRAGELGVSYATVLFGAYFVLLRRYTGQDDLLASLPFHGRTDAALRDTVGYLSNLLPIRQAVRESDTYAEVIGSVRARMRAALTHGELPLPSIMREAGLTGWDVRDRTHGTLFQYWHAGLRPGVDLQDLTLGECSLRLGAMESSAGHTFAVMVREDSAGTHVLWKDPTGAVGETLLQMMAGDYAAVLTAIATDPHRPVAESTDPVPTPCGTISLRRVRDAIAGAAIAGDMAAGDMAAGDAVAGDVTVTPTAGDADVLVRLTAGAAHGRDDVVSAVRAVFGDRAPRLRVRVIDGPSATTAAVSPADGSTADGSPAAGLDALAALWSDVLGLDVAPEDSFFELGGHSLLAESLVLAVSEHLGRKVAIRTLFEHPRLGDFAEHLGVDAPAPQHTLPPAAPEHDERGVPASAFQQRIRVAERLDGERGASGAATYNVPLAWRVTGTTLDAATLTRALALLIARHEILRTRFVERDGALHQLIDAPWQPGVEQVDLPGDAALHAWLDAAAEEPFDVASGRLLTAALLDTGGSQVLFVCLHHLVWDGESAAVFLRELADCYAEATGDVAAPVGPSTYPASPHQERMAFIDEFEKGSVYPTAPTYHNLPLHLQLRDTPDPARLQDAVDRVVAAHEALRTDLVTVDGRTAQRVHERVRVPVSRLDPGTEALDGWCREPFEIGAAPLFRVAAQPRDGGLRLVLCGHQGVVDRAALRVVAEDLLIALDGGPVASSSFRAVAEREDRGRRERDLDARAGALRGEIDPVRLPERRPRAHVHVYAEHAVPVRLPADLLTAAATRLDTTGEAVCLAAFAALLAWYSGSEEMVLGVTHTGRDADGQRVVGPLANLLPLRLHPAARASFAELTAQVAAELAAAREHDRAPFDELVRRLDPAKDMSRTALFDILFTWAGPAPAGVTESGRGHGKYDLHLFLAPEPGGDVAGDLVFNGLYFDDSQAEHMAEHYLALLRAVLERPDRPVGEAEPLTERERHTQLAVWNDTDAGYPETTLHALLTRRADEQPTAPALTDATTGVPTTVGYGALRGRAERLARAMVARGVRPGELVALLLPRGVAQVESMLAVLMAGAAYLPLDPQQPVERTEFVLADSGTRWVVTDGGAVPATFTGTVVTPADASADASDDRVALPTTTPDSPAYCIYTSGTTGRPKGVVITHRNAVRLLVNDRFPFSFGPTDVWTMFHSYAFDFSVWELFGCLAHGGRLVLVGEQDTRDPHRMLELLGRERVTVLNQTPSAFRELLAAERERPAPLEHLRYVVFGGEALQPSVLGPWMDDHPRVRFVNMYGITETTVHVTVRTVTRADADAGRSVIGVPIPTTGVHLLDPRTGTRLLPVGAVGEMYIGGAGVAGGYLGRPELTDERFVPNPFGPGRLFRSGDLARHLPDGSLEFLGRIDAQVQVRGHRVEPAEIETRLREHPGIADAAVVLEDDLLVAYLLPDGEPPVAGEVRAHLRTRLPSYMVPGPLRSVTALPRTRNGKLDLAALRTGATALGGPQGRAPATPTAEFLAGLWAELLGVPRVGADDSFFALGGHSIVAVRMLGRLRERLGTSVALRLLFENPVLGQFADAVDAAGPAVVVSPGPGDTTAGAPLASGFQERIWLAEQHTQDTAYAVVRGWHAPAGLDHATLQRALDLLIERNEILRTAFRELDGRLRQVVGDPWTPPLQSLDLRRVPDPGAALRDWSREQRGTAFDPAGGRLFRAALADRGADGHTLLLALHHLVIDGESMPALLAEIQRCYDAVRDGTRACAPAVQYRDLTDAQQESAPRETALAYWAERLDGAPAYAPLAAPAVPGPHGAIRLDLPADLPERLAGVRRDHGVTLFVIVATALAAALHRSTGCTDLTVGVPLSVRDRTRFTDLIGPCLNTVVLRSRPARGATLRDLLAALRTDVLDSAEHGDAPFDEVVGRLNPPRETGRAPYVDVTLNTSPREDHTVRIGDGTLTPAALDTVGANETKFALTVTLVEERDRLSVVLAHRGDRVCADDARRVADTMTALLTDLPTVLDEAVLDEAVGGERPRTGRPQFRDFVAAQALGRDAADLDHWSAHLDGAPAYLDLSVTGPEPEGDGVVAVPLPAGVAGRLRRVQREQGVTLFGLAATALAVVLHRWTGRDDVVFATPLTLRDDPRFAELIGPCMDTVPLRSRVAADTVLRELLLALRGELLDAHEHRGAGFDAVVERLNPPRRPGRTPFADVTLSVETAPASPPALGGGTLVGLPLTAQDAGYRGKLGLSVVLTLTGDRLDAAVSYRGETVRRADVTQLATLFGRVLARLPELLESRLDTVDLLGGDPVERARLLGWESGGEPAPATTVPALLARWSADTPDAPAVDTARGVLTHRGLHRRALVLAAALRPLCPPTDAVVALVLGRGADLVVAMLAAWYAGAAFCPLDPAAPAARTAELLDDLGACAVITDVPDVPGDVPVLAVPATATEQDTVGAAAAGVGAHVAVPHDAAYIVYTSGTTGRPKGVVVRHSGLAQLALWGQESFALRPGDRTGQVLGVAFDATQWDVWPALAAGGCVVPHEGTPATDDLAGWLTRREVSVVLLATPLAEALWAADAALPRLRLMIVGAAALTTTPPADAPYRIRNAYGPTESTVIALTYDLSAGVTGPLNTIGRPITGTGVHILDPAGRRCPAGVPGEVCLSGAGVAAGYRRRPELTADRFQHPAGELAPLGTIYRTGDRGRWLPEGTVEYLGRTDRQLKIRGHRIEPGEIEAALLRRPDLAAAVVHGDPARTPALVAYLVPQGTTPGTTEVLDGLRSRLPAHMVPEACVWLDRLPLNASGKVDTARLPQPRREDLPVTGTHTVPRDDLERRIAAAWAEVLRREEVGVHDNFFDLGGNSLSLARLHTRLTREVSAGLALTTLYEHTTVATLARFLSTAATGDDAGAALRDRAARARRAMAARGASVRVSRGGTARSAE